MLDVSDERLAFAFAQDGRGDAMEELFRRHLPRVYGLSRRYFKIREDAEEATSETFLRAFRALRAGQFRGEASFVTWLLRIAANTCLERIRQPRLPELALDRFPDLASSSVSGRDHQDLFDAIALLPDDQRLALTLCDLEGYQAAEAASVLGRTLAATKSLHYRARRSLKNLLEARS